MSYDQMLILRRERLPSIDAVTRACAGDKLVPMRVDLSKHSGFLPVAYEGRKTGFEYYFGALDDELKRLARFGGAQITVSTGARALETLSAMVFLKNVAGLTGAAYCDPQGGNLVSPERTQAELSKMINQFKKMPV